MSTNTHISFNNMIVNYTKQQQISLGLNPSSNISISGSKPKKCYLEDDPQFPIVGFEQGFEALDNNSVFRAYF